MTDIDRIDRICDKLRDIWYQHPEQRLGQLILNYAIDLDNVLFFQNDYVTESNLDEVLRNENA